MSIKEEDIVSLINKGKDREVVPLLYKKVYPLVERYIVRNSGKKDDAQDVFQDALLLFYKQIMLKTYDQKYKVFGYLYKICIYKWVNKAKKNSKIVFVDEIEKFEEPVYDEFTETLIVHADENIIRKLFNPIGEKCIELLTYTTYSSLLLEDIMIRMDFNSVSAVKMQLKRCKEKLLKQIDENPALINQLRRK
ncbi:RNA polymerase sigma factor [Cytophaga hutchinsonii]|uniref:DNA-directed RNA polymerase specialized sigma subunit n=1 Tax=Cytophaga hutchinsonii (strain ATCC 33406 / DSM 1761 / CIP 103989 / NBRC 15051 / NCIMB 9469 / D465) TaxID=269798 RepID=A0A6N4SP48_CYTH3|nr:RNA polymerase sigma factor [Cytophaga hutchinsonii]ABG58067.1 DNA-directed RNA polymerase specialized sigma subunit [Cytophaga hutchinsonii ATCC 33406]SFX12772.1 DNA-directed RNA polymerase specialized sigma subunit, sigma24 family [Cytophaga hutchinsonii ATCC 33406]